MQQSVVSARLIYILVGLARFPGGKFSRPSPWQSASSTSQKDRLLKSTTGSDNVTLENYAGSRNDEWVFQIYGVPTADDERKGQTFHEQHRDAHRQHGETPTTLSTEKK